MKKFVLALVFVFFPSAASQSVDLAKGYNDFGILLRNNIVSEKTDFEILTPEPTSVSVMIYDNQGNLLFVEKGKTQKVGSANLFKVSWGLTNRNGRKAMSGTYIIQATAKNTTQSQVYQYFVPIGVKQ